MKKINIIALASILILGACSNLQDGDPKKVLGEKKYKELSEKYNGYIGDFSEGYAPVAFKLFYDSCTFINTKGEEAFPWFVKDAAFHNYKFQEINAFHNGLALVKVKDADTTKYGFINTKGDLQIDCKYYDAESFSEGFAVVGTKLNKNGWYSDVENYGFINTDGQLISEPNFTRAKSFSGGYAVVRNDQKKYGYVDTKGNVVIECSFDDAGSFVEGIALVAIEKEDDVVFVKTINSKGETLFTLPSKYTYPEGEFSEGYLVFAEEYETGEYEEDWRGREKAKKAKKYGYMNTKGEIVLEPIYEDADNFKDGKARVQIKGASYHTYINTKGEEVPEE